MPVFHTRTIESILEPVAQQVSRLVILHEEAEDGNAMPDLSKPVMVVKMAVDNLVQVGYETVNTSDDALLKQDMPPALKRVEQSAASLLEASDLLRDDPYSAPARKKLIEGSRGILQGTSSLLLAFDESEVRKIIAQCKGVQEYLAITEVLETMDDLVTFVKNLSPGLTRMTKQVDDREKELTHQVHKDILLRCLDQIKVLTPVLISCIKVYINLITTNPRTAADAKENRNFTCKSMTAQIQEIIRVLQLTSSEEDDFDTDDVAFMQRALNDMNAKMQQVHDWLLDPSALPGGIGERALHSILDSASKAADKCAEPADREAIRKTVGDIRAMVSALNELKTQGKGDSPQAQALAKGIQERLGKLNNQVQQAMMNTEKAGARAMARTLEGRVEQAQRWLVNPAANDKGNGEQAVRSVIGDGRKLAATLPAGREKEELLKLTNEVEMYTDQLSDLCKRGMGGTPQAKAIAKALAEKLNDLRDLMNDVIARKVVDDFVDIGAPLKALTVAATASPDTPHREAIYYDKAAKFEQHTNKLAETSRMVASSGGVANKKIVESINSTAREITQVAPQVVRAGKVVLLNPGHEASREHFEMMKQQWSNTSEKLRSLIDESSDTVAFIKASEAAILEDTSSIEQAIISADSSSVVDNAADIARLSNRVLQVAQLEADNSEDFQFVNDVSRATDNLKSTIPPMVRGAKALTIDPRSAQNGQSWRQGNDQLVDAVKGVRLAVTLNVEPHPPPLSPVPVPPDMTRLTLISDSQEEADHTYENIWIDNRISSASAQRGGGAGIQYEYLQPSMRSPPPRGGIPLVGMTPYAIPPRPPLPDELDAPPRPPLPSPDQDAEMERVFLKEPLANQPIMIAAHDLHQEVKNWESADNELIQAAKKMALLMANLSQLVRGEGGSKRELIDTAKAIAEASDVVTRLAKGLAAECTDKRMRTNLLQVCERIPTIGTQLKILSTVKATMLGAQGSEEDEEATEMLVGNAQNLMQSVRDTVRAAEAASIKIRVVSGYSIRWVRRRPWYT